MSAASSPGGQRDGLAERAARPGGDLVSGDEGGFGAGETRRFEASCSGPGGATTSFWLATGLGLALFAACAWRFDWLCDDAYISFRYARNLVSGHGLVFNLAGPAVEGYSNLAWVLVAALLERLGTPVESVRLISAACGAVLVAAVAHSAARGLGLSRAATLVSALFLASLPPFAVWATSGLETMPFALAVFAFYALLRDPTRVGRGRVAGALLAGACAVLLRADGLLLIGLAGFSVGLGWRVGWNRRLRENGPWLLALGGAAAAYAAQAVWRQQVYGDWIPNTVRAKAALSPELVGRGGRYVAVQLLSFPSLVLALGACVLAFRRRPGTAAGLSVFALGVLGYGIATGGDFMAMGRFLVPALPMLALAVGCAVEPAVGYAQRTQASPAGSAASGERRGRARALVAVGVLVPLSMAAGFDRDLVPESVRARYHFRWNSKLYQSEYQTWLDMQQRLCEQLALGRAVGSVAEPGGSLVAGALGGLGWLSGLDLLDQNGLVDRQVAEEAVAGARRSPGHDRYVPRSFFRERAPSYAAASLIELATGRLVPPEHWDGDVPPERAGERYSVDIFVRSDAPRPRVGALRRLGWNVANAPDDEALAKGFALRLVRWR